MRSNSTSAKDLTSELLAAMDSEPSGISDGNNSGLPSASESASVLPVDSSPFSNLANDDPLRGLAVMAKVAGKAEPQHLLSVVKPPLQPTNQMIFDLVENNIEVTVPVIITINTTMSLDSVYAFRGTKELVGRLNLSQKRGIINLYLRVLEVGFMEQPLSSFGYWFKDLCFADAILKPEDSNKIWHFCHVLLSPKSVTNISLRTAPKNFFSCARRFYEDMFHASPSMNEQIERAMNQDVTILFLAIPVGNKSAVPKSFSPYSTSLITVAGVSFQMFRDPNDANLLSVFLSLLRVTHHLTAHPFSIQS